MKNINILKTFASIILSISLIGCSVAYIKNYEPPLENLKILKTYKSKISVENNETDSKKDFILCRNGKIDLPPNQTLDQYIFNSLKKELSLEDKISHDGTSLKVKVERIEVFTMRNPSEWKIDIKYVFENKEFLSSTIYPFTFAHSGDVACRNAADTFNNALSENYQFFYKNNFNNLQK